MKYVLFDKESLYWLMVYCTKDDNPETLLENISKAMLNGSDYKKFNAKDHVCINAGGIKSDENIFSINEGGVRYLWQLGGKVTDMTGCFVPHLYNVRKIGMIV